MSSDRDILFPREVRSQHSCARLSENEPGDHGFVRSTWFAMLGAHCFAGKSVLYMQAQIKDAKAVLPVVDEGDHAIALANYYSFAYGPIFTGADDDGLKLELLRQIAVELRRKYRRVSFYPLIENEDGIVEIMRRAFAKAGWIALLTDQNSNHTLDVAKRDFAAYWATRPGALRSSVRRKGKNSPYRFRIYDHVTQNIWDEYRAVYSASWKNAEPYPDMVRAIADEAASRGALRLGMAYGHGGTPVATQLWTIEGDTGCIHKIAHDTAHDKGSPGTLLSQHMFAHMIDVERVAHIDYGTGGNSYKRDWMERERAMLRLDCFDPRKAKMWLPALKTRISQLVRRPS
ncbi:MAG: GNAT family N-acetyltransferase [Sphingobium sp.]|nr:GNAT family N-acetyltransferase [Sphingobium sp.]MCP5399037.1 GNAT family N-acetyltransferase [Sphingomonas sp.]